MFSLFLWIYETYARLDRLNNTQFLLLHTTRSAPEVPLTVGVIFRLPRCSRLCHCNAISSGPNRLKFLYWNHFWDFQKWSIFWAVCSWRNVTVFTCPVLILKLSFVIQRQLLHIHRPSGRNCPGLTKKIIFSPEALNYLPQRGSF